MKITRNKGIAAGVILVALVMAFFASGQRPSPHADMPSAQTLFVFEYDDTAAQGQEVKSVRTDGKPGLEASPEASKPEEDALEPSMENDDTPEAASPEPAGEMAINPETGKDQYLTDPVPEGKPIPVEPQDAEIGVTAYTCTLSVACHTILDNLDRLDPEKVELVPEDGVIFAARTVIFYEGESVFNVLQREMKANGVHMEFSNTPIYNSAYIEGIHNLYEFDCGDLSGWMYRVNDWFPNYGASRYQLKQDDAIEWIYTCDLGRDIGGYYAVGGQ